MKSKVIRTKLGKRFHPKNDTILLETIEGTPRSPQGGVWIEAQVSDIETLTEGLAFDPVKSGWKKYLDKWYTEGLITAKERDTGKS